MLLNKEKSEQVKDITPEFILLEPISIINASCSLKGKKREKKSQSLSVWVFFSLLVRQGHADTVWLQMSVVFLKHFSGKSRSFSRSPFFLCHYVINLLFLFKKFNTVRKWFILLVNTGTKRTKMNSVFWLHVVLL